MYFRQARDSSYTEVADVQSLVSEPLQQSICLDFDGLYADVYRIRHQLLQEAGFALPLEAANYELAVRQGSVPAARYNDISKRAHLTPVNEMPQVEHSATMHAQLRTLGQPMYIVTSRTDDMMEHLILFLVHYDIRVDGVVNVNLATKSASLAQLGCALYIDDSVWKLVAIEQEAGSAAPALVHFRHTYDLDMLPDTSLIHQVESLTQIPDIARACFS